MSTPSTPEEIAHAVERMALAQALLLLLDYDGTMTPIVGRPELARPDDDLRDLLGRLSHRPNTWVEVVSGRTRESLEGWLGDLGVGLHAEHGFWSREQPDGVWRAHRELPTGWKAAVRPIFDDFVSRTPGSFIEEKSASLAWHYRQVDAPVGIIHADELHRELSALSSTGPFEVLLGDKVIEVRLAGVNKGVVVPELLRSHPDATVAAFGDDTTDADLFAALPEDGLTIHVGPLEGPGGLHIESPAQARRILRELL
ncbi:MAG: trehalose-phosphatase [Polyangiaceae bacterium]|nr:trehalose-phosphatase [Polyangiaceae bacterium]